MIDFNKMGKKLRIIRENRGLTLTQVANAIDKSASLIGSIERADRTPSLSSLYELAQYYEIPLSLLFEDDQEDYQKAIADHLENTLKERGYSIADLATLTGINYFELAEFFQAKKSLTLNQLKHIADVLNLSVEQITPHIQRNISYIEKYLEILGMESDSIENIINYIYSKLDC